MFKPATKYGAKLRAAAFGPAGSGKTYTALRIATGMAAWLAEQKKRAAKIAVIDTERGSASKYADRFKFDVNDLEDRTIDGYTRAIADAGGYDVLIIDSLSHAWRELLLEVDRVAQKEKRGNKFAGWSWGSPKQKDFVEALLACPAHVIATMRCDTEWQTTAGADGKARPVRIGLKPEQGKEIEYEFDLLLQFDQDHNATVLKDRTGKWQDVMIEKPGEDFGRALAAWLHDGAAPPVATISIPSRPDGPSAAARGPSLSKPPVPNVSARY